MFFKIVNTLKMTVCEWFFISEWLQKIYLAVKDKNIIVQGVGNAIAPALAFP